MASEIRVDKINSLSGVGTVTLSPTGVDIAGITTAATLRATTGIVTSLTAGSLTSLGDVTANGGDMTISGSSAILHLVDTNDNPNYRVQNIGGTFQIYDATTDTARLSIASGGAATISGDLTIPDKIIHSGDTDTAIRFSDADTISFETGGSTRAKITSTGNFEMPNDNDYIKIGAGGDLQLVHSGSASFITNSTGFLEIQSATITFENASGTERARISSNGKLLVGTTGEAPYSTRLLTVGDTSFDDTAIEIRSSSTTGRLYFTDSASSGEGAYQGELTFDHTSGNNRMHTKIGNTTKISVTSDGLTFNGDTAATNALDDYEEGSWTPDLNGGGSSTWTSKDGKYQKVGNTVTCWMRVDGGNNPRSGSNGHLTIYNIPFALDGDSNQVLGTCGANVDGASGQNFIVATSGSGNPFIRTGGQNTTGITVSFFTAVFTYNTTA